MQRLFLIGLVCSALTLGGCANVNTSKAPAQMGNLLLAEPVPASARSQMAIARYNHILSQAPLQNNERAELLFQRGILYDSVGLPGLAQYDYNQAIKLKPDMAEAWNSIGVHYTQQREFIQAYEAFDSTLDINPEFEFAFLNRGIALYYGGRPELAVRDLGEFYNANIADPYRALWSYIAMRAINPEQALLELADVRPQLDSSNWATLLVDMYLGRITENQLLNYLDTGVKNNKQRADRLCEAYFYLGKYHSAKGNTGKASSYFKLALSTNVYEYVEHRYARLELNLLRDAAHRNSQAR